MLNIDKSFLSFFRGEKNVCAVWWAQFIEEIEEISIPFRFSTAIDTVPQTAIAPSH